AAARGAGADRGLPALVRQLGRVSPFRALVRRGPHGAGADDPGYRRRLPRAVRARRAAGDLRPAGGARRRARRRARPPARPTRAAWSGTELGRRLVVMWCVVGLADLVTAVTMGILSSQTSLGLLAGPISTAPLAGFPLSLIPTFLVPLAAILHLITLRRVLEPAPAEGERVDAPRAATAS